MVTNLQESGIGKLHIANHTQNPVSSQLCQSIGRMMILTQQEEMPGEYIEVSVQSESYFE